jgi:hypothetical protein
VCVDARPVRALLVDGTIIRVRALDEADAQLVAAFYRQLPVHDRYLRFFSASALPAAEDLIASRGPTDASLGAFRGEELIGVAQCYGTRTDPSTAEVALAVAHEEQTLGVGTLLLEHVVPPKVFASAVSAVRADPGVDAVVVVAVATALTDPFPGIASAAAEMGVPILAVRLGQAEHVTGLPVPGTGGIVPVFADAAAAAGALAQAAARGEWLARPRGTVGRVAGIDAARAGGVVAGFLAERPEGGWLGPAQVQEVLEAFGLPVLPNTVVDGPDEAVEAFAAAGGPVAVKAVVDGVLHKAAAGAVRLGLDSAESVRRSAAEFAALFGPRLRGCLVQPMAPAGPELLLGVTSDPSFGPLVTVGLGGTATDLAADRAHRLVPLSDADAEEMLVAFHAGALLFDQHSSPAVARAAVVDAVVRVGNLAEQLPDVAELDLNPLVVGAEGCVVVDARIRAAPAAVIAPRTQLLNGDLWWTEEKHRARSSSGSTDRPPTPLPCGGLCRRRTDVRRRCASCTR